MFASGHDAFVGMSDMDRIGRKAPLPQRVGEDGYDNFLASAGGHGRLHDHEGAALHLFAK